ncbi:single-stranded-DNA-specific exonuclease C-terminal domain-containing protein [Ammoniphilus sp. YIM 78166]|uniref:single-stranded-DNA-specific exonuclease C-terminal domain-containing protein n=1 Tax=Ammoniphilus sp. YIM 78166 TaxID=1644106 RepID=UPI00106F3FEC|nr:single-stranded-DNA-specific exonuclease C-terminal domain-containing protein [Ammoniphilus sp. YIM 78166]
MLSSQAQWLIEPLDEEQAAVLQTELGISPLLARVLVRRELRTPAHAKEFLYPTTNSIRDASEWNECQRILSSLHKVLSHSHPILITSSQNQDALIASSILIHSLLLAEGSPERIQYEPALSQECESQSFVRITIGGLAHSYDDCILLSPERLAPETETPLSVSGLCLVLAYGLLKSDALSLLDLALLGTLSAQVPLRGVNRTIVKMGLKTFKQSKNVGVKHLQRRITTGSRQELAQSILSMLPTDRRTVDLLLSNQDDKIHSFLVSLNLNDSLETEDTDRPLASSPTIHIDTDCSLWDWSVSVIEELELLAPFGPGNPSPVFLLRRGELKNVRAVGLYQEDMKCTIVQGESSMDGLGVGGIGKKVAEISKHAIADLVGQPVVHEWNGVRKPQFMFVDMAIEHTQVFDYRGVKDKLNKIASILDLNTWILCFRKESLAELVGVQTKAKILLVVDDQLLLPADGGMSHLIWYDMPFSLEQLTETFSRLPSYGRLYCVFGAEHRNRLAMIPTREQFKWLYGTLVKKKTFKPELVPHLAKTKGISEQAVYFMLQVFLELGFVKNERSQIEIVPSAEKRELTESVLYRNKQKELELETEILYSSFESLCQVVNQDKLNYRNP